MAHWLSLSFYRWQLPSLFWLSMISSSFRNSLVQSLYMSNSLIRFMAPGGKAANVWVSDTPVCVLCPCPNRLELSGQHERQPSAFLNVQYHNTYSCAASMCRLTLTVLLSTSSFSPTRSQIWLLNGTSYFSWAHFPIGWSQVSSQGGLGSDFSRH